MTLVLFSSLIVLLILGVPIAVAMGVSSTLAVLWSGDISLVLITQKEFTSIDSFSLMAIPFFILAGTIMERGGISRRLINFASSIVGHISGGLGLVVVMSSMFFAAISGSGAATVAAVGSILIPAMIDRGYHKSFSAGLTAVSGELGVIIPPSINLIIYGVATGTSIGALFIAGIIPGAMIGISLLITVYFISKKRRYPKEAKTSLKTKWKYFKKAIFALFLPIIILGGIYSGMFTPTEASIVAVVYVFIIGTFVYKEIKMKDLISIFSKSAVTSSIILFIIANAGLFGVILSRERVFQKVTELFLTLAPNPFVFLICVNIILLIVGMFFEGTAAIVILAPLLAPAAIAFDIDPIHFGIIMVVNLAMGMCTPPLGVNLFLSCRIANISLIQITKAIIPFIIILLVNLFIISFFPQISLWLTNL